MCVLQETKEIKIMPHNGQTFELDNLSFEVKKVGAIRVRIFDGDGNMDVFTWPECQVGF